VRDERGSVSIVAAATIGMVLVLIMGSTDVAHVLVARAHAETAADASSLAAAQELAIPSGRDPCEVAAEYASRNRASLQSCAVNTDAYDVTVGVTVDAGSLLLFPGPHLVGARSSAAVDVP
jgi:secretion/DNA translocation related TadE-like protein